MLTLHHLEYSQSFRILWLLEELGLDYELKVYKRDPVTFMAPADYKALSPLGTAPVITHEGRNIAESNNIVDYILDRWPNPTLRPQPQTPHRDAYLYWFHLAQGSLMPIALTSTIFGVITSRAPSLARPLLKNVFHRANSGFLAPRIARILREAEKALAHAPYFAGPELTAADIVLIYPMLALHERQELREFPACLAWVERVHARPAYQRAIQKDGRESVVFRPR